MGLLQMQVSITVIKCSCTFGLKQFAKLNIAVGIIYPNVAARLERQNKVTFGFHAT